MGAENWLRTYTMKCGPMGSSGFEIGNTESPTQVALHMAFSIEKSAEENPNNAKVQVWNLSPENVSITESKDCVCELKAGYGNNRALVFVGNVTSAITTLDGADKMTEMEVVDGLVELRDTNISVSMNGQVDTKDVYQRIADEMGIAVNFADDLQFKKIPNGFSYTGKAKGALDKAVTYNNHVWSIQNQILQVTMPGRALNTQGYLLSPDSGLISIPKKISIGSGEETKTGWEVEYLMNCAIGVNDMVHVSSKEVSGDFRVYKVSIDGDNMEGDWKCTAQLLKIAEEPKLDAKDEGDGSSIKKGDKVRVIRYVESGGKKRGYQYAGGMFVCWYDVYDVIQAKGDRIVIGIGSTVTAAVKVDDLEKA